jgi:hypothetical protein
MAKDKPKLMNPRERQVRMDKMNSLLKIFGLKERVHYYRSWSAETRQQFPYRIKEPVWHDSYVGDDNPIITTHYFRTIEALEEEIGRRCNDVVGVEDDFTEDQDNELDVQLKIAS